jgi:hypothetical protein
MIQQFKIAAVTDISSSKFSQSEKNRINVPNSRRLDLESEELESPLTVQKTKNQSKRTLKFILCSDATENLLTAFELDGPIEINFNYNNNFENLVGSILQVDSNLDVHNGNILLKRANCKILQKTDYNNETCLHSLSDISFTFDENFFNESINQEEEEDKEENDGDGDDGDGDGDYDVIILE